MHFAFDDDQIALRDAVGGFLEKRAGLAVLQRAWTDPAAADVWQVWADLAGMGVQGLLAPEAAGGSGMDQVTMALVLTEAGRAALPLPLLETAALGIPLLAAAGDPAGIVPGLVGGAEVLTAAVAGGAPAPAVTRSGWFLVEGDGGVTLYRRDQVEIEAVPSVDRTRDTGRVHPVGAGIPVPVAPTAPGLADRGALGAAAVLVGLGRSLVDMTVSYVKDRRQFGVPVGSFQAVKHQLADAAMHVEFAAPAVWAAAWQLDAPSPAATPSADARPHEEPAVSVSVAKALASDAAERAARIALQCHGAMGYTDDYHLHLWLKRVWCLSAAYGNARWHRARVGARLGLGRE